MHYEVEINEQEAKELVIKLESCYELSIEFFENTLIDDIKENLRLPRYEVTRADIWDDQQDRRDWQIEFLERSEEDNGEGKW